MELTQCINYLLTTAQHKVFQEMSSRLEKFDVTPVQYGDYPVFIQLFHIPRHSVLCQMQRCLPVRRQMVLPDRLQGAGACDAVYRRYCSLHVCMGSR